MTLKAPWEYIDTHCHIEQREYAEDRHEVIERAIQSGIAMVTSAISEDTWEKSVQLSSDYVGVYASIGQDPVVLTGHGKAIAFIREHSEALVAIGEVGLDHYRIRDHSERNLQEHVFQEFIMLSMELDLPVQVHSRSAGKAALEVLEQTGAERVHMHAFDGRASYARTASEELGYYFSIPTSVTRSRQKQKLVKAVEIEHLLLETDSPVLGPVKGERNEPSNITIALREVAKILGRNEEELRETVLENTLRLYKRIL